MNYTEEEKFCILLGEQGVAAAKFHSLLGALGSVSEIIENFTAEPLVEKLLGEHFKPLCKALKTNAVQAVLNKMEAHGIVATTCFSPTFPESLRQIPDPPFILFCRGNLALLKSRCLGVVGTRKVSSYGKRITADFTRILAEHFTVVSGLAYGVDALAHETALSVGGSTIAVLGGSLIKVYPSANQGLAEKIVQSGGLLVSEYGTDTPPLPYRFPHRNRIVSGLSLGLLVCQSPTKSGTASTVEWALEQGRDVFAVPGEVYDNGFSGNNQLIKTLQGACVLSPRDICDYYNLTSASTEVGTAYQLNFEEQAVVEALSQGQLSFDDLVQKTKISAADLNFLLANLEIKSIIARLPGNSYRLYGGIK